MRFLVVLSLAFVAANALTRNGKEYKPGYMLIPDYEKYFTGEKKFDQKPPTTKFTPRNDLKQDAECGVPNALTGDRIVGGQEAEPHQFPWQVGLFFGGYFCGGTIISETHILTAAHCAEGQSFWEVVVGAHNIRTEGDSYFTFTADIHPDYDAYSISNDLAILTLDEPIPFGDTARPNCLPTQSDVGNDFVGEEVLISGWGRLSDSAGSIATYLNYVDGVPIISQQECEAVYGSLNEGVICIDTAGGRGSCNGDSGGPMSLPGDVFKQIGIVSFGASAGCEKGYPAGFSEITMYLDWISSVTGLEIKDH